MFRPRPQHTRTQTHAEEIYSGEIVIHLLHVLANLNSMLLNYKRHSSKIAHIPALHLGILCIERSLSLSHTHTLTHTQTNSHCTA